jgi:hypothetical protein
VSAVPKSEIESQYEHRLRLYRETDNDAALGRALGMTRVGARSWRNRNKLPAKHSTHGPVVPADDEKRRMDAYKKAKSDEDAGRMCGISGPTFRGWRNARGLPSKGGWGGKRPNCKSRTKAKPRIESPTEDCSVITIHERTDRETRTCKTCRERFRANTTSDDTQCVDCRGL